jgi:RHS repeat-associated protein
VCTHYFGGYEKITNKATNEVEHRYQITVGGSIVAVHSKTDTNLVGTSNYLHKDALGSTDLITDDKVVNIVRLGYTPFGTRRNLAGLSSVSPYISSSLYLFNDEAVITNRGFTGHEHIDELDLIHMNGRVYDPGIGRFLSPDTIVQAPKDTQSYNRYAYVKNNPLKYTDPTGHSWLSSALKSVGRFIKTYGAQIVVVALSIVTAGAAAMTYTGAATMSAALGTAAGAIVGGAVGGFVGGFLGSGGDLRAGITGAVFGAITAGAARWVKGLNYGTWGTSAAHGLTQGVISEMRGGTFKEGFLAGFVSHATTAFEGQDWYPSGEAASDIAIRTTVAAMSGGVASSLGGGKFKNGAVTAAFVHLFNNEGARKEVVNRHRKLVQRVAADFKNNPGKPIFLSLDDVQTIVDFEKYQAETFGQGFIHDGLRSGKGVALSDSFLRDNRYNNHQFIVEGYGTGVAGDVNYIAGGVSAAHYGVSFEMTERYCVVWNELQLPMGMYNLRQMSTGSYWAAVDYLNY